MRDERFAVVISRSCCGGFPAGAIVKVSDEQINDGGLPLVRCYPVRNTNISTDQWHCTGCLLFIPKEEAYGIKSS